MSSELTLSVIVPVYNSEQTLTALVERLACVGEKNGSAFEIILVNDGSWDGSWQVIQNLAASRPYVHGINLLRNFGQHNALLAGIRAARYRICITLDDDLQNPPEEIPALLAVLAEGKDVVYGVPAQQQHGFWRDASSSLTKLLLKPMMPAVGARNVSAFRVFRAQLRDAFTSFQSHTLSIDVLLSWGTARFGTVQVRHELRQVGRSNYSLRKLIHHAVNMFTGFSILPLRLASFAGFLFMGFGLLVLAYVVIGYMIFPAAVHGFTFLASIVAIFSGVQLFSLGVIGEYIGRIHQRLMDQPCYVIAEETPPICNAEVQHITEN
jgi:undecaprenyl-phosphate 4-deoxy-4-formamido-L-arabinose transferase